MNRRRMIQLCGSAFGAASAPSLLAATIAPPPRHPFLDFYKSVHGFDKINNENTIMAHLRSVEGLTERRPYVTKWEPRQTGTTSFCIAYALWRLSEQPNANIMISTPNHRMADLVYRRLEQAAKNCPEHMPRTRWHTIGVTGDCISAVGYSVVQNTQSHLNRWGLVSMVPRSVGAHNILGRSFDFAMHDAVRSDFPRRPPSAGHISDHEMQWLDVAASQCKTQIKFVSDESREAYIRSGRDPDLFCGPEA